jgi:hypothetical protein
MFLGLLDPDALVRGMDPDPDVPTKGNKQKTYGKFFVGVLKANYENSRIRILIRIQIH